MRHDTIFVSNVLLRTIKTLTSLIQGAVKFFILDESYVEINKLQATKV